MDKTTAKEIQDKKVMQYAKFEKIVANMIKEHPEIESIAMTDSFFDGLRHQQNRLGFFDFRRILGLPISCTPDGELFSFSPNKGKFNVNYKFIGMHTKWQ